jgi:tetratricopeptide (TPR) repeat protein
MTLRETTTSNNRILLKLEEDGFITPDEKAKVLIEELSEIENLYSLKLLFENPINRFSPKVLRDSLVMLVNTESFDYYEAQSVARLELHLRTWVAVLEQICFTQMRLSKELRDKVYNSLPKFAEIHRKTTQVMQEGIDNKYSSDFNQFNQLQDNKDEEDIIKKRNYNIDYLLIHLRDTLHSLRDDETWFQEIMRRTKDLLKAALNIAPGILSTATGIPIKSSVSTMSMLTQLRQGLSFKYPVASYYVDWRIMLIIQRNIFIWSESSENIISKKFGELVLIEYIWSFIEREWDNIVNKSILDSQSKFDEMSNKVSKTLRNTGSILNDIAGNEPLALPHTLWFGILDLAQNLVQKSTRTATYGLCYYLAIESLNKAPSSFIQFKAIELLLHLHNIDNQMFSMIEIDFDQYSQKLSENNSTLDSLEKFQNLLIFVKEKYFEDLKILNDDEEKERDKGKGNGKGKGKGKGLEQSKRNSLLDIIADEMSCSINNEPTEKLCILKCQHTLSLNSLNKLKQKKCPKCREKIEDKDVRYLLQDSIYKNLYSKFFEAGHILPSIELGDDQYDSEDSNNSEVDQILTKKKKIMRVIKFNSNILLSSIFPKISRKQHPIYQNIVKELNGKNYTKAVHWCNEFLKTFPKSYSMRCILAYIYRCLNKYEKAHSYLDEAIKLKEKTPMAYFIRGEIFYKQNEYEKAIDHLNKSLSYKSKINKLYVISGNSYLFTKQYDSALNHYNMALKNDPNYYACIKSCAYSYEMREDYFNALETIEKLLNINSGDSLILCYYGEILCNVGMYKGSILYFSKAINMDPENHHILYKRAIAFYVLQEYGRVLLDLDKIIQLDPLNNLAYYQKCITYYTAKDINNAIIAYNKCKELLLDSDDVLAKIKLYHLEFLLNLNNSEDLKFEILTKIDQISDSINDDKFLLSIRCKIYLELKKHKQAEFDLYRLAKFDLDRLFELSNYKDIPVTNLLQEYTDFWLYLCNSCKIDDLTDIGIINDFDKYMYKGKKDILNYSIIIILNTN